MGCEVAKREWRQKYGILKCNAVACTPRTMELPMRLVPATPLSSLVTALVLAGPGAFAQTQQERQWCESETGMTADQRIDGCSAVIKAGREKGDKLAEVFNNRGVAYRVKGDHKRAIPDYGQATKL